MEVLRPTDLTDALHHLQDGAGTVLAGGTDLLLQARAGRRRYGARLVSLRGLDGLRGIDIAGGSVRIGAMVTQSEILRSDPLADVAPVMQMTANAFASAQIRNAGTLGGNLCNASPAGDMAVPLLLLDAEVCLVRLATDGIRRRFLPLARFLIGPGQCDLQAGELLEAVTFPVPPPGMRAAFRKSGPRPALEISVVSIGALARIDGQHWRDVRLSIGAAAPTALRLHDAEAELEAGPVDNARIDRAAVAARNGCAPIDDLRASAWYRRHLAETFARDMLHDLAG
jgi:CO/xanthine dehydrogenase FAD-binding subunit